MIRNFDLYRLKDLAFEQAQAGGLPVGNGGSEFGCYMAACEELLELRRNFLDYARHRDDCAVRGGHDCTCGCSRIRKQVEEVR